MKFDVVRLVLMSKSVRRYLHTYEAEDSSFCGAVKGGSIWE